MKKIKFLGFIAILAVICLFITSCEFGGTLTIENKTDADIQAYAISIESALTDITNATKTIEKGKAYTWEFSLDGEVNWSWTGIGAGIKANSGKTTVKGGKGETITAQ